MISVTIRYVIRGPPPPTLWRTLTSLGISYRKRTRRGKKVKRSTFSPPVMIQRNSDQLPACINMDSSLNQSRFDSSTAFPRNSACSRSYTRPDCMAKSHCNSQLCIGLWNARSMNNKTTSICDLILGKNLNVIVITESWLKGDSHDNCTIADIKFMLPNYEVSTDHVDLHPVGGSALSIVLLFKSVGIRISPLLSLLSFLTRQSVPLSDL